MTISSTTRKVGPFLGNDAAVVFPFPFKVFEEDDLLVVQLEVGTGIETELLLDADYSVSLNFDQNARPGGAITLPAPLATGYNLTISSDQPELQETDIRSQGGFYPEVLTAALDRAVIDIQELKEKAERSLCYPISDPPLNATLPPQAQRANKFLYFGDDGSVDMVTKEPLRVKFFAGALTPLPDGVNCTFTLTDAAGTPLGSAPLQVIVWRNFPQTPGVGYAIVSDQITFTSAPDVTDVLYAQGSAYL